MISSPVDFGDSWFAKSQSKCSVRSGVKRFLIAACVIGLVGPWQTTASTSSSTSDRSTESESGHGAVTVVNGDGRDPLEHGNPGPPSSTSNTPLRFIPVDPCRIADTRETNESNGGPVLAEREVREFTIPGAVCGIPSTAKAYALNVTVVPQGPLSWLTLWPAGQAQPAVSTLNSTDGRIKANAAIVPAGTNGSVDVFVSDSSHVILDITGYFVTADDVTALTYYPLNPCRVVDTRGSRGSLAGPFLNGGQEREFAITTGACNIPGNARAYSLNVTAVPKAVLGYLTVWPSGRPRPAVSTLNAPTGTATANAAIVPAGQGGDLNVFATHDTDLIVDVNGYYAPAATGGLSYYPVTPCRVHDSRNEHDEVEDGPRKLAITNSCNIPATAQSVLLNATVVPNESMQYLALWPDLDDRPTISTLNAYDGKTASNMAVVATTTGKINAFTAGSSHLILDTTGYYGR